MGVGSVNIVELSGLVLICDNAHTLFGRIVVHCYISTAKRLYILLKCSYCPPTTTRSKTYMFLTSETEFVLVLAVVENSVLPMG